MITPARSIFIGLLAGLLGFSAVGLVLTLFGHPVTVHDLWMGWVFLACAAGGGAGSEVTDIRRQLRSDAVGLKERLAKIAPAPAPLTVAAPDEQPAGPIAESRALADEDGWYVNLRVFFSNGQRAGGFSHGKLGGTMLEESWEDLCKFYCSLVGKGVLRLEPGNKGYVLNYPDWTHAAVMREIINHALPHPQGAAPDIETLSDDAARRSARRSAEPVPAGIIENDGGGFPPKEPAAAMPGGQRAR